MTGAEQIVASPAGRWKASISVLIRDDEVTLQYRATMANLMGRVGTILVGPYDGIRPDDASFRQMSQDEATGHADGAYLFDHAGFGQTSMTRATVAAGVAQGSTELLVSLIDGAGPRPGHYFGIGQRLYIVRSVWPTGAASITMRFWPRLRAAASPGDVIILDRPLCMMRLAADDTGILEIDPNPYRPVSLSFVEAL
jgi:hypothetical protein